MPHETALIALFGVATAVALAARALKVPYTVALVVAGLVLGTTHVLAPPHLTRELLYDAILPGLLFEAAFHLDAAGVGRNARAIGLLAVPGVVAGIALTAALLVFVVRGLGLAADFGVGVAAVFAALIAATDPIAVVAVFRTLGAPSRLVTLIEAESLLNDGTAVVLFTLVLGAVTTHHVALASASLDFVSVVGLGAALGAAVGFGASRLMAALEDPMLEITLTTLTAYGAFVVAERLHCSGVIATVAAGMVCGNAGARTGMSPSTRLAVVSFWQYVAFALNSVVFLLIGFEVHLPALRASWALVLAAYAAMTLARAALTVLVSALLRRTRERMPWSWSVLLTWGGLRGALSMVLALGLPAGFPRRDLLVTMTFGVVTLSILLQGLTMRPLLRRFGIARPPPRDSDALTRGTLLAATAALGALDAMVRQGAVDRDAAAALRAGYEAQARDATARLHEADVDTSRGAARQLLVVQKDAVRAAARTGALDAASSERLLLEIDAQLVALAARKSPP